MVEKNYIKRTIMIFTFHQYKQNDEVEENELGGACTPHGGIRDACRLLVGKPEGKRPVRRPRQR
jgi:hypothetical protein